MRIVENRSGQLVSTSTVQVSAGAADEDRVPSLDADGLLDLSLIPSSGLTVSWGDIIGTLADQVDLVAALASKLDDSEASAYGLTVLAAANAAALKTLLALVKADVGLGSVDNTADAAKNVLSANTLTTARNFSISGGGITASAVSFNGSAAVTLSASVDAGHITLARMANLAANSFIGNNTGSAATPIALTVAQAKTLLAIAAADVSGLGTAAVVNTGTSGATIPLLNGANTFSALQTFNDNINITSSGGANQIVQMGSVDTITRSGTTGALTIATNADNITMTPTGGTVDITGLLRCDSFRIDQAATAGTFTHTHYATFNLNGTDYRFPCGI